MTPVGHSLFGATIAVALGSREWSWRTSAVVMVSAVVSANWPDLPVPGWGHDRYDISHSVFVGAVIAVAIAGITRLVGGGWRVVTILSLSLFSHYLLDTLYSHGKGIGLFWPMSEARAALPVPWFETAGGLPPPLNWRTVRVLSIELVCYGAALAAVLACRWRGGRQ